MGATQGKNRLRCVLCFYQRIEQRSKRKAIIYLDQRIIAETCINLDAFAPMLIKKFDDLDKIAEGLREDVLDDRIQPINLETPTPDKL